MVGLPALGKSTIIDKIKNDDTWIYSTDMFIEAIAEDHGITYSEAFTSNIQAATTFSEQKVKSMMKLQRDILWDQTNLGVGKRKKIVKRMKAANYTVNCICIMPPETAEEIADHRARLNNRPGKVIPNYVLANMMESYVPPTMEEGFDAISFYNMYGEELEHVV